MTQEEIVNDRIEVAVRGLVSNAQFGNKTVVSVPVLFPSGAHAGVEISLNGDDCFVSDAGQGYTEAGNYNASDFYRHSAREACERFGTSYDGLSMFVLKAPIDRIEAAIAAVANSSAVAARDAVERATIEKSSRTNAELFDRFLDFFGEKNVTKTAEIKGKSVTWDAHNVVHFRGATSIFEYVADHPTSISSKFMMFSDLHNNSDTPLILNAVLEDVVEVSEKARLIKTVTNNFVPFKASKEQFLQFARAA